MPPPPKKRYLPTSPTSTPTLTSLPGILAPVPSPPSSVLPFPSQTHDRFSFRPSPFLFLPVPLPPAYPFLQQSSSYLPLLLEIFALQPPIAYSRARLLAQLICNIATANHPPSSLAYITLSLPIPPPRTTHPRHLRFPPSSQLISPSPIRSLEPAEPRAHDNFPLLSLRRHLVSPHLSSIILSCRQIVVSKATRDTVFNGDVP
ncbi:hypothetical protein CSPX01_03357 [Colletotrichum filicis]|nr:hypothetical protein CSPX01_03357 [Colletotrichum filicis]